MVCIVLEPGQARTRIGRVRVMPPIYIYIYTFIIIIEKIFEHNIMYKQRVRILPEFSAAEGRLLE